MRVMSIGLALLLTACATMTLPTRYPSRPPAGLSADRAEQDQKACLDVAAGAKVERSWTYIGCMVSKGHSVSIPLSGQGEATLKEEIVMYVAQTRPHEAPAVATELEGCRRSVYLAGRSERDSRIDRIESGFRTCLDPLGYVAQRAPAMVSPPRR
jgi:hypothetical protein